MTQVGLSELEFAAEKKGRSEERLLDQIEAATPWHWWPNRSPCVSTCSNTGPV